MKKGNIRNLKRGRGKPPAGMSPEKYTSPAVVAELKPTPASDNGSVWTTVEDALDILNREHEAILSATTPPNLVAEAQERLRPPYEAAAKIYYAEREARQKLGERLERHEKVLNYDWLPEDSIQQLRNQGLVCVEEIKNYLNHDNAMSIEQGIKFLQLPLTPGSPDGKEAHLAWLIRGLTVQHQSADERWKQLEATVEILATKYTKIRGHEATPLGNLFAKEERRRQMAEEMKSLDTEISGLQTKVVTHE